MARPLLLLLFLTLFTSSVWSADHSKWKTCNDSAFCKRNRAFASSAGDRATQVCINSENLRWDASGALTGTVARPGEPKLPFSVQLYFGGSLRFSVWEDHPKRYRGPSEVLLPSIQAIPFASTSNLNSSTEDGGTIQLGYVTDDGAQVLVELTLCPLKLGVAM